MAISYSYPLGTPKLTDTVLGIQYEEMKDPAVKNFSINDIVTLAIEEAVIPTLQGVTNEGANTTVQMQINGVDVATVNDIPVTSYSSYIASVDYNSVNNVFIDEIGFSSVVVTNPSNGKVVFTKTGVFTGVDVNKICFLSQNLSNSGQVFVTLLSQGGVFGENPNDKMTLNIFDMAGGQTGTPFGNVIIEVRIYN